MAGDVFGDAVNVAARPARPCRRQRDARHARRRRSASTNGNGRAFATSTGCSCAAGSNRCTCICWRRCAASATPRPRPSATWRPASTEPEGIRLLWLDVNRIFAGTSLPVMLGRSPQATYIIDDNRVSRSHARIDWHGGTFQLDRPELQRHLRALRQRPGDHQPAPRRLHVARQRRDRPRHAADRAGQPVRPLRSDEVRRHPAADPVRIRRSQVLSAAAR